MLAEIEKIISSNIMPFSVSKSNVELENNYIYVENKQSSGTFLTAYDNSNIIISNNDFISGNFKSIACATNNSNVFISDNKLIDNVEQFFADNNSYINYNFSVTSASTGARYNNLESPLWNDGNKYITYDYNHKGELDKQFINNLTFFPPPGNELTISASVSSVTDDTLSARIASIQYQLDKLPSVLNGYSINIILSSLNLSPEALSKISGDRPLKMKITKPLVIHDFYQGTVNLIGRTVR
jgi:hypothetical protein